MRTLVSVLGLLSQCGSELLFNRQCPELFKDHHFDIGRLISRRKGLFGCLTLATPHGCVRDDWRWLAIVHLIISLALVPEVPCARTAAVG
jgi:hypothetical protein